MTIVTRVWISFAVTISLGLGLSWVINQYGDRVKQETRQLVERDIPNLIEIRKLRGALVEHERLLYEYYATNDRRALWPEIQTTVSVMDAQFSHIYQGYLEKMELKELVQNLEKVRGVLDVNLGASRVDWDQARSDLEALTALGKRIDQHLHRVTWSIEEQARSSERMATNEVSNMVAWVVGFSVFISLAATLVGYYVMLYLKDAAKRKDLALIAERNPTAVIKLDWKGQPVYSNKACKKMLEKMGLTIHEVSDLIPSCIEEHIANGNLDKMGDMEVTEVVHGRVLKMVMSAYLDLQRIHLHIDDITEEETAKSKLEYQALHDVSTGLKNRRAFEDRLNDLTTHGQCVSISLIAMDRMKLITTSQGYQISDQIIQKMSLRLLSILSNFPFSSELYRLDGNTFALLITSSNERDILTASETIQLGLEDPLQIDELRFYLTVSVGIAQYPKHASQLDELMSCAHSALYRAKSIGDQIEVYEVSQHSFETDLLPIELGMRKALEQNKFELFYQGKVDSKTKAIASAEALIRWKDGDQFISPGVFIPIAEQTGFILRLGAWVIQQAFKQSVAWAKQGLNIQIAVNISARQFQNRYFLEDIQNWVAEYSVNPESIELEITEGLLMDNVDQSIEIMLKLKSMGFDIAIDDFGTGYSSLSYLKQFPIDTLKIDRAFVKNLEQGVDDQSIVSAIASLAKHLHLKVVAEGVETEGQLEFLTEIGCDLIQGFLFCKPIDAKSFIASID